MAQYTIPTFGADDQTVHGYLLEALQEGEAWLKAQRPSVEWQRVLDALAPDDQTSVLVDQSSTGFTKTKRISRDLVASLSNFRYEGEYRVQYEQSLTPIAQHLTKRDRVWFQQTHTHDTFRKILQYAVNLGTGYGWQVWDKNFYGVNQGDVRLTALGPDDVLCVQLTRDHDLQRAYAVIIREELPINLARRIYHGENPLFASKLMPDRDSPGWLERGLRKVQQLIPGSPIFKFTGRDKHQGMSFPTVDIFHAYIMDSTCNLGPDPRLMGKPGTNWSYRVPVLGSQIPSGQRDPSGAMTMKTADEADALLFPTRRHLIFARSVNFPAYDGPSAWWHGKAPVARFRFGDLAWEALGASLVGDVLTMNKGVDSILRDIEDSSHARMDPPAIYDDSKVSKSWAEAVNPRRAGVRAAADMNFGEVFKILGEQWQYEVPTWIPEFLRTQESRMDYLAATPDLVAIAKAKQVPGSDTLEKLLEMAGPLVQDMIRGVEAPQYELGEMRKALYVQFDTKARWMQLVGPTPGTDETFQWNPSTIIPAGPTGETPEESRVRRKLYLNEFKYHLSQSGVNEIHRMTTKLFYLQLIKLGFPIDWWTFARIAQIPNFGPAPVDQDGNEIESVMERWVAQRRMMAELQGDEQKEILGPDGQPARPQGRPNVNTRPPQIVSKDGGARSTIKTS